MACSQELCKGDLVAVSVAMEAAGQEGYITRGSIVGSDLPANSSLYVGKSHSPTYLLWQRATWIVGPFACARNDQATHAICNCQFSCFCIIATMLPYVMSYAISQHAKFLGNLATWTTDIVPIDIMIPYSRDQHVSANALQCIASANSTLSQSTSANCNVIMLLPGKGIAGFSRQDMFKQPSGVGVHMTPEGLLPRALPRPSAWPWHASESTQCRGGTCARSYAWLTCAGHVCFPWRWVQAVSEHVFCPAIGCIEHATSAHVFCPAIGCIEHVCFSRRCVQSVSDYSYFCYRLLSCHWDVYWACVQFWKVGSICSLTIGPWPTSLFCLWVMLVAHVCFS